MFLRVGFVTPSFAHTLCRYRAGGPVVVGIISARYSGGDPVTYSIVSGNTANTFALDNWGILTVTNNSLLDYATLASQTQLTVQFELFVNLLDQSNPSLSETNRRVVVAILPVRRGFAGPNQPGIGFE